MYLKTLLLNPTSALFFVLGPVLALANGAASAAPAPAVIDDFSNATRNGGERLLITDKDAGSQSQATQRVENGHLVVTGDLKPGRGAPAFISIPLLLTADGQPRDASRFQGVRVRLKLLRGMVSVQVSTPDVTNFDYHTSAPLAVKAGEYQEVKMPFRELKRGWSEQTPLNVKAVTSVNLVAFGLAPSSFAYEIDEIGFY